jgi:hypothetical protein
MMFTGAESVLASSDLSDWASRPDPDLAAVIVEVGSRALAVYLPESDAANDCGAANGRGAANDCAGVAANAASTAADRAIDVLHLVAIAVIAALLIARPRPARGDLAESIADRVTRGQVHAQPSPSEVWPQGMAAHQSGVVQD